MKCHTTSSAKREMRTKLAKRKSTGRAVICKKAPTFLRKENKKITMRFYLKVRLWTALLCPKSGCWDNECVSYLIINDEASISPNVHLATAKHVINSTWRPSAEFSCLYFSTQNKVCLMRTITGDGRQRLRCRATYIFGNSPCNADILFSRRASSYRITTNSYQMWYHSTVC